MNSKFKIGSGKKQSTREEQIRDEIDKYDRQHGGIPRRGSGAPSSVNARGQRDRITRSDHAQLEAAIY